MKVDIIPVLLGFWRDQAKKYQALIKPNDDSVHNLVVTKLHLNAAAETRNLVGSGIIFPPRPFYTTRNGPSLPDSGPCAAIRPPDHT